MADPVSINPTLTLAGQKAALSADNTGIELKINYVSYGTGHYDPTGDEVALKSPVGSKIALAGGSRPTPYQLRTTSAWSENVGEVAIGEIGFWADDILCFVWSKADGTIASYKTDGVTYVLFNDLAFAQVPAGSISFTVDENESVALAALAAHEGASNAHPQYLLRQDVAKDSGPLAWLGKAAGTANALVLTLVAGEAIVPAYAAGQRYQFIAAAANTGAVTANVEGLGVVSVKKGGDGGLVDLEANDIRAGAIYDLNYDGTHFQLGGGVGANKAYTRFSYTAYAGQSAFTAAHTPGSVIVTRNGREVTGFTSDVGGTTITMTTACAMGESVEILAFKPFLVADTYTKAEIAAMFAQAGAAPVGMYGDFPTGVVPAGWLECDNAQYLITAYPDLYAVIGTKFNLGNETAGYFRVPEARGEFFRGWDHGRGVDAGRAIGTYELDQFQAHWHNLSWGQTTITDDTGYVGNDIKRYSAVSVSQKQITDAITDGVHGTPRTGSETRPRNLSVMRCIKAFGTAVNQGMIDVAGLAAQLAITQKAGPVLGSVRNGSMATLNAATKAIYSADEVIVTSALGGISYKINTLRKQIDIATVGANGMDVGTAPASGYLALYAILDVTNNTAGLLAVNCTSTVAPEVYGGQNMPAGYSASTLLTVIPTDVNKQLKAVVVRDRAVSQQLNTVMLTSSIYTNQALSLGLAVPVQAKSCSGEMGVSATAAMNLNMVLGSYLEANNGYVNNFVGQQICTGNVVAGGSQFCNFANVPLATPQAIMVTTGAGSTTGTPSFSIHISGYTI